MGVVKRFHNPSPQWHTSTHMKEKGPETPTEFTIHPRKEESSLRTASKKWGEVSSEAARAHQEEIESEARDQFIAQCAHMLLHTEADPNARQELEKTLSDVMDILIKQAWDRYPEIPEFDIMEMVANGFRKAGKEVKNLRARFPNDTKVIDRLRERAKKALEE